MSEPNADAAPRSPRARERTRSAAAALALLVVLAVGAGLRFNNLDWDSARHLHPDERYMTYLATLLQPPQGLAEYFDSGASPLNPYNTDWGSRYVYGTLPLFVARYAAAFLDGACESPPRAAPALIARLLLPPRYAACDFGPFTGYDPMALVGRAMSGLADLAAIAALYLIGRRLFGRRVGLLAAGFGALTVLQIQQAHFFTTDSMSNLFVVLTILACTWLVTTRSAGRAFWFRAGVLGAAAGAFAGLGVASKISVWPLVPLIMLSFAVAWWRHSRHHPPGAAALALGGALVIAGLTAFAAFRVAQPYSFVGTSRSEFALTLEQCEIVASGGLAAVCRLAAELPEPIRVVVAPSARWIEQLTLAQGFVNGTIDAPFGIQWSNRAPIAFPLVNLLFFGMGLALGLAGWVGFFVGARETLLRRRWWLWLIPVAWTGAYFLYQSTQWTKSIRYLLPIYPMLSLFAAAALVAVWDRARAVAPPRRTAAMTAAGGAAALVVGLTAVWAAAFSAVYAAPTTRVAASDWIYRNVPSAVTLEWDGGADGRQLAIKSLPIGTSAPTAFPISRLDIGDAPASLAAVRLRLNHLDGEGIVYARVLDLLTDTPLAEARKSVSAAQPVVAFDGLELKRGRDYFVELQLVPDRFGDRREITARASVIGNEQWDDPLPSPGDGRASGLFYTGLTTSKSGLMQPYDEDTPDKLPALLDWLDEADYVVLSSNRVYASVARLPWRYPLTNEYYRALLAGELGYELAADFHSYPRLAGLAVNTHEMPQRLVRTAATQGPALDTFLPFPPAEEAFSVYDHPRVLIFRKTRDYSREHAERLLGVLDLTRTLRVTPIQAGNQPGGLMLTPSMREEQQAAGTWSALFPEQSPLNQSEPAAALAWLALIELLGLAAFPLMARLSRGALFDGGYAFAKVLGLLLVAYGAWLAASARALPFSAGVIWAVAAALAVVGAALAWRDRAELAALIRRRRAVMLGAELMFLLGFAAWLAVRSGNPDLWHPYMGGEKPMDFAYLNAILRSTWFPPMDPWFAGGYINYYYFGFVIVAAPIKALGIEPAVAYNLAVPTLYGLVASGAYGLGATLAARTTDAASTRRSLFAGALAALFVVAIGNAQQLWVISGAWTRLGGGEAGVPQVEAFFRGLAVWLGGAPLPVYAMAPYWDATRIDPAVPIAEFPLFTFLYADLHAHMIAMPLVLSSIAVALVFASGRPSALGIALGALVVGSLFPTNSWDYPIYLALCAAALVIGRAQRGSADPGAAPWPMVAAAVAVFIVLSRGWFAPFFEHFGTTYSSVDVWTQDRTSLAAYLKIHGLLLVPIGVYLARGALRSSRALAAAGRRGTLVAAVLAGAAVMALAGSLAVVGVPTALVSVPVAALAALAAVMPGTLGRTRVLWLAVAGAAALTLFVELFALRGDIGRMNTVFKFYVQAWLLFGIAAAAASTWLLADAPRAGRFAPAALVVAVAGIGLVYPLFAIPAKINDRMAADAPRGLDGEAFMRFSTRLEQGLEQREFALRHDAGAIEWLRRNVTGSPTIMEGTAAGELYRWGNRMSIYTGLPSVVGWWWHQHQQRMALPYSVVSSREQDVASFYSTRDTDLAATLLRRYKARYVVLGDLERAYYDPAGLSKFARMESEGVLRVAYRNEGTTIYEVVD